MLHFQSPFPPGRQAAEHQGSAKKADISGEELLLHRTAPRDHPAPAPATTTATFPAGAPAPTGRPGSSTVQEPWPIASSSLHLPGAGLHQPQTWHLPLGDLCQLAPTGQEELGQSLPRVLENTRCFKSFPGPRSMPKPRPFPVAGEQHRFLVFS